MGIRSDAGLWVRGSKAHSEWRESQACAQELKPELKYTWEGTRKLHMSAWARSQRWERACPKSYRVLTAGAEGWCGGRLHVTYKPAVSLKCPQRPRTQARARCKCVTHCKRYLSRGDMGGADSVLWDSGVTSPSLVLSGLTGWAWI